MRQQLVPDVGASFDLYRHTVLQDLGPDFQDAAIRRADEAGPSRRDTRAIVKRRQIERRPPWRVSEVDQFGLPVHNPNEQSLVATLALVGADVGVGESGVPARQRSCSSMTRATAFVMYGVQGRTWVAMGDPVGSRSQAQQLDSPIPRSRPTTSVAHRCSTRSDRHTCIAMSISALTFVKLGEEARVDLHDVLARRRGARGEVPSGRFVAWSLTAARTVSCQPPMSLPCLPQLHGGCPTTGWRRKAAAEKGLLARLLRRGLPVSRFPLGGRSTRGGAIVAFANLWPGPRRVELSMDLMRFSTSRRPRA